MRVEQKIFIEASPEDIWEFITDPKNFRRFMEGITRWDVESEQDRGAGARYSMRMFAVRATSPHLAVSVRTNSAVSWGVFGSGIAPRSMMRFFISGSMRISRVSALIFSTIGAGVPAGTNSPAQPTPLKPG